MSMDKELKYFLVLMTFIGHLTKDQEVTDIRFVCELLKTECMARTAEVMFEMMWPSKFSRTIYR